MELTLAAREIVAKLQEWEKEGALVVGLDGYSGIGKTTLSNYIAEIYSAVKVVAMDDYVTTANTKENLLPQIESESPTLMLEWKPVDGILKLKQAIEFLKNDASGKKIILVEGIFLYHPILNDLWDKRMYLEGDFKQADMRREKREKERWGEKYMPETHPDSYARLFTIAYKRYLELYKLEQKADLVVKID